MIRHIVAAAVCVFMGDLASKAIAAPITEAAVEEACGEDIEGGCVKKTCSIGCQKWENGKLYDYGCSFPNKPGATTGTCSKKPLNRVGDGNSSAGQATGGVDAGAAGGSDGAGTITGDFGTQFHKGGTATPAP